jgi:hypothetical protein
MLPRPAETAQRPGDAGIEAPPIIVRPGGNLRMARIPIIRTVTAIEAWRSLK